MINHQSSSTQIQILFLYMVPETGHQKAADALIQSLSKTNRTIHCKPMAVVQNTYPLLGELVNQIYLNVIQRTPMIWDFLYDNPDIERWTRDVRQFITSASASRTQKILKQIRPDAVVCTQAVAATAMALEKKEKRFQGPLIGVVTDFNVHRYWVHPEIDLYIVANNQVKKKLIQAGIKRTRIVVTGIPIRPDFSRKPKKKKTKHVLLVGGGRGLGSLEKIVRDLLKWDRAFKTKVVCGRNTRLQKTLTKLTKRVEDIQVYGYVKNMASIMAETDIVMTKPGGLTCSEALAQSCALILVSPLPGPETRNAQFLKSQGVALVAKKQNQGAIHLRTLLQHPAQLKKMTQKTKKLAQPESARDAVRAILKQVRARK